MRGWVPDDVDKIVEYRWIKIGDKDRKTKC